MPNPVTHIIFYLPDGSAVEAAAGFLTALLGWPVASTQLNGAYVELTASSLLTIGLVSTQVMAAYLPEKKPLAFISGQNAGPVHLSVRVEEVEALYQKALALGATALAAPQVMPWGHQVAFIQAPQGFTLELAQVFEGPVVSGKA